MSASAPTSMRPLAWKKPYILAWLVAVSATNSWSESRLLPTPSEKSSGRRSWRPGTPFAISLNVVCVALRQLARLVEAVRRMVGREHLKVPSLSRPDRLLRGLVARRRAAAPLRALEPGPVDVVGREKQVLRAGLGEDARAGVCACADRVAPPRLRHVHDEHRHVEQSRERDRAVGRLALGHRAVRISRGTSARGGRARAGAWRASGSSRGSRRAPSPARFSRPRRRQHIEHLAVVELQQLVGHVDLERGDASPTIARQFCVRGCARRDRQ